MKGKGAKKGGAEAEAVATTPKFAWTWNKVGDLIYGDSGAKGSKLVAAFDMDSTLIVTKSGKKLAGTWTDWQLFHDTVASKVQELSKKGYSIVVISNQGGVSKGHVSEGDIKKKFQAIGEALGVSLKVLMATGDSLYRKPCPGMWNHYTKSMNDGIEVDLKESFYCGDAAGRVFDPKKKDHSDTDYTFALNVGLPFKTPESFFLGEKDNIPKPAFDPRSIKKTGPHFKDGTTQIASDKQEVIVCVGSPGSGKSTFSKSHLKNYERVNQDTLKTKEKCHKAVEEALKAGKSVVIDNTNRYQADRSPYIELAKAYNVPIRCFWFNYPKDLAFHLNQLRVVNTYRTHNSKNVADVQIHSFYKQLETPTTKEGFKEVKEVECVGGPFEHPDEEKLFFSYVV